MPVHVVSHRRKRLLIRRLNNAGPMIRAKYGIKRIGVFGSFARGEQTRMSDVDVLVEFLPGHETFKNFMHLSDFLEALLRRKVDLLTEPSISDLLLIYRKGRDLD